MLINICMVFFIYHLFFFGFFIALAAMMYGSISKAMIGLILVILSGLLFMVFDHFTRDK
jgi:hypothetical protein